MIFPKMHCFTNTDDHFYAIVGLIFVLITILVWAFKIFAALKTFVFCRIFSPTLKKTSGWAIVTGSTDGIGKAYAEELARRGYNLILISRTQCKLDTTAKEFEETYGINTITIQADFSGDEKIYFPIREKLQGLDIDILVNNVGTLGRYPCEFLKVPQQECIDYLYMNVLSVVMMCQIVLPRMVEKRHGYVVNMSSISSVLPLPLTSVYTASKAFVTALSQSLNFEYEDKGITIQALVPSYISTKLVKFSSFLQKPSFFVPDATTYARSAINTLTVSSVTTGYWIQGFQCFIMLTVPRSLYFFSSRLVQVLLDNREKERKD